MAQQRAKNRAGVSFTSITEAAAYQHNDTAPLGATLFCEKIPGFHLLKQARGSAWRWRYTDATGRRKTATVGKSKYPEWSYPQKVDTATRIFAQPLPD